MDVEHPPVLEPDELRALLHLRALPGLGDRALRSLLTRHGSARAALAAPAAELGEKAAAARGTRQVTGWVERALETLARGDVAVLVDADPRYPAGVGELHDPPVVLFARGRLELLDRPAVAVVGTRRPTTYGEEAARSLAAGLARAGVVVVSGMARGIDATAQEAALAGGTIGVLGCGIDVVYPPEHARLYARVAAEGLLLSEFLPGEPALRFHFPRRNRIIAALARAVLVVEASAKSGSLITVDHALDLGRDVLAVPGPIGRESSAGTNALIQQGARLVAGLADVLEEIGLPLPPEAGPAAQAAPPADLPAPQRALWRSLSDEARHVDEVAAACGMDAAAALTGLLELELAGRARQIPGMRFLRS